MHLISDLRYLDFQGAEFSDRCPLGLESGQAQVHHGAALHRVGVGLTIRETGRTRENARTHLSVYLARHACTITIRRSRSGEYQVGRGVQASVYRVRTVLEM